MLLTITKIIFFNIYYCFIYTVILFLLGDLADYKMYVTMNPLNLHKVFVYGTLKRGEPNHQWFSKDQEGYYKYLYNAKTTEKYPLIIGTKYNIPFLLFSPGNGTYVEGEVYEVDDKVLAKLDILEDHPNFYIRDLYDVKPLIASSGNETIEAWIYVIKNFKKDLLNQPFYENYSNLGIHGRRYVERYLRGGTYDHKTEIFSS